jgi:hypothetical protein
MDSQEIQNGSYFEEMTPNLDLYHVDIPFLIPSPLGGAGEGEGGENYSLWVLQGSKPFLVLLIVRRFEKLLKPVAQAFQPAPEVHA